MARPLVLFWIAAGGATVSLGTAWHELSRLAGGLAGPLDGLVLGVALLTLLGSLLVAGRILYTYSQPS